jgi:hypothetical protein
MKKLLIASLLLMLGLVASLATAQTSDWPEVAKLQQPAANPSPADGIRAARSRCATPDNSSSNLDQPIILAQYSRSGPHGPLPRRAGGPRSSYPRTWTPSGSGKHALIGALIGFGIGAAVAAKGHGSAGTIAAIGALGGAIGAGLGAAGPPGPPRNPHRRPWDDEYGDEYGEDARLSPSKAPRAKRAAPQAALSFSQASE